MSNLSTSVTKTFTFNDICSSSPVVAIPRSHHLVEECGVCVRDRRAHGRLALHKPLGSLLEGALKQLGNRIGRLVPSLSRRIQSSCIGVEGRFGRRYFFGVQHGNDPSL
jgi:hypothetical protein